MAETESVRRANRATAEGQSLAGLCKTWAVPFIILLNLALTLALSYKLNIWVDEAFSLHTTEKGLGYALDQALNFELQAPLYFALLALWRKLNSSIFFARLFSVICVALAIWVTGLLSRRLWRDVHPGWLAACVAFNPLTIAVAIETRLYALVLLFSALLLLAFYDGYLAETRSRRAQICYILLAIAALYTQYYMGFLLAANACALLVLRRWRALFEYMVGMLIAGLCFAPMLPFIRRQMSAHTAPLRDAQTWFSDFKFILWRIKDYLMPVESEWMAFVRTWVLRLCYVAVAWIVIARRRQLNPETISFLTIALALALFFLVTARLSGQLVIQIRHTAVFFLPLMCAAFALVVLARVRKIVMLWTILALAFAVPLIYARYRPMAKQGDWQRVAAHLMAAEKPEQAILIFHAGAELPLSYYYAGRNRLVPLPRDNTFERFDFHDYILRDEREIRAALERTPGNHKELWLVTDGNCGFSDISYNCALLEDFVNKYYTVEETRAFHGSRVRFLKSRE